MKRNISKKLYDIIFKELSSNKDTCFIVINTFKDGMYGYFAWKGTVIKSLDKMGNVEPCLTLDRYTYKIFSWKYISIDYATIYNINGYFSTIGE